MARYTINTYELCQQLTGLNFNDLPGLPFDKIDDIANAAIPLIFSDRYDLLDNGTDRNDLLRMILEHYWEYELCCFTPSDFILRINRKLNEIAPLYNQRYESTKLEYPIFDDIKYDDDGTDGAVDQTTDEGTTNTKHSDRDVTTVAHTGTVNVDSLESGTTKTVDVLDGESKHSGTIGVETQEDGTTTVNTDHTETDKGHDITTAQKHTTNVGKETSDNKQTDWDYKNDTPQGSISGITDQDYLTSYSKHTTDHDETPFQYQGTVTGTYFDGTSYSLTSDDSKVRRADHLEATMDIGINDQKQKTSGTTEVDDTQTTLHGKGEEQTTTYGDKVETDNTDTNTITHGKGVDTTTTYNNTDTSTTVYGHNIKTDSEASKDFVHDGEYHKHVEGKYNSGKSYMQMLQEYRDVMINIYQEIIDELRELFFIIY